jgi:hypothetical protein
MTYGGNNAYRVGACDMYKIEYKCTQDVRAVDLKEIDYLEDLSVNGSSKNKSSRKNGNM